MKPSRIKQPIREAYRPRGAGSTLLTIPPELGIQPGDWVQFVVENGEIVLKRIDRR